VDVPVNNVGIFEPKPFAEIPDADWYRLFETNVMSGVRLSRHYVVGMLKRNWSRILFDQNSAGHHKNLRRTWQRTLARAKVPYFRIYDLRSTYATRLSAGGVADEWVTQKLRQGDAQVFKKYSQMKLQMKREALEKINRQASEMAAQGTPALCTAMLR
jgi:NAD(P)-dependent dehydrogenase (short-subunit alcohol dehydrogenase family)